MAVPTIRAPKKLILCCDGTWMDSDNSWIKGSLFSGPGYLQTPSNVTRIGRALLAEDRHQNPQIVYYQSGVGSGNTYLERLVGGGTGEGIGENIREAYGFLANNYTPGDSIFLLGFSRGAFTARSVGGLIGGVGLLEKKGMPWFYLIFKDWENAGVEGYDPAILQAIPDFKIGAPASDIKGYLSSYKSELIKRGITREVTIQAIGVWDTVGALGIPTTPLLQKFGFPDFLREYKFLDTSLDNHISHAFQALALDEQRASYAPAIWEKPPGSTTTVKQVWFPGVHSNVGGSYDDTGIADLTLAWMMSNLSPWLDFDPGYLKEQRLENQKFNASLKPPLTRGWALGRIYESCKFPTSLGGREPRTPQTYTRTNYFTGKDTKEPLEDTNEAMHASVRARLLTGGKGYEDVGPYEPESLLEWNLHKGEQAVYSDEVVPSGEGDKRVRWVYRGGEKAFEGRVLFEDQLGEFELELLRLDGRR